MARTPEQQRSEAARWRGYWKAKGFSMGGDRDRVVLTRPDCRIEYKRGGWHVATAEGVNSMRAIGCAEMLVGALKLVH
ncbi:hypothetical protein [Pseudomonas phage UF_RH7]|nr:hypothetical protein [Pseudomonas phage UF_RH7]